MIIKKKKIYISLALERFGTTVKEQIDNSEFSKDVSGIDLIFEILDALEFMHNIEYIFRDIKPSDIIKHNKTPILIAFDNSWNSLPTPSLDAILLEKYTFTMSNSIILVEDLVKWKRCFEIFLIDHCAGDIGNKNIAGNY